MRIWGPTVVDGDKGREKGTEGTERTHKDRVSANVSSEMAAPALRQHGAIILALQMCFICLSSRRSLDQHGHAYPNTHTHTHIYAKIIVQFNSGHSQRRRFSWRPIRWAVIKRFVMPARVRRSLNVCLCVCVQASDNKAVYVLILLAWKPCSNYARQQTQQQNREKTTNPQKIYVYRAYASMWT